MITIIDYGSGNLKSIYNAFNKLGETVEVTKSPEKIVNCDSLVLPGVGAFGKAMENISPYKELIIQHINAEKPFLGICLGLQLLLSNSDESPNVKGLDIFKGNVKKFPKSVPNMNSNLKIPHMGWNQLNNPNNYNTFNNSNSKTISPHNLKCPLLEGINFNTDSFYFVHSYYAELENSQVIAATTKYGIDVSSVIHDKNTFATQFHPEKSGKPGLKIIKNFINIK
ncbi:MAG: imidazole glycerol phosphate synthase subunit HisH [Methanobacteriaceae archaeon]